MRSSRSASRVGLNSRIERGPLGGVSASANANATRQAPMAKRSVRPMGNCGFYTPWD